MRGTNVAERQVGDCPLDQCQTGSGPLYCDHVRPASPGVYVDVLVPFSGPVHEAVTHRDRTALGEFPPRQRWSGASTVAAFLGQAELGPYDRPILLSDWRQFDDTFGQRRDGMHLSTAVHGFFANGGTQCYVVRLEGYDVSAALEELDRLDIALYCAPDLTSAPDTAAQRTASLCLVQACELRGDRIVVLDAPPDLSPSAVKEWRLNVGLDSSLAALYYPWLKVRDPDLGFAELAPPSGHVAGLIARTDATRGFHQSPGNETVRDADDLAIDLSQHELDLLTPVGINALVRSPSRGVVMWGARTLSSDPAWRYLRRARLVSFTIGSIRRGTDWVILRRADRSTRAQVASEVADLLHLLWRGARSPETPPMRPTRSHMTTKAVMKASSRLTVSLPPTLACQSTYASTTSVRPDQIDQACRSR